MATDRVTLTGKVTGGAGPLRIAVTLNGAEIAQQERPGTSGKDARHCPDPGRMRTRAMASLRRPVPIAWPVTTGLRVTWRAGPPAVASPVSVVYSDTCSPAVPPGTASAAAAGA